MIAKKWKQEPIAEEEIYEQAAVGGCASCANPADMSLPLHHPTGRNTMRSRVPSNHQWYRERCIDACVCDEIASDTVTVPAADAGPPVVPGTNTVRIQPARGCFLITYWKVFAFNADTGDPVGNVEIGPGFVAECRIGCRTTTIPTAQFQTNDCLGCPLCVLIGRADDDEDLRFEVTNPNDFDVTIKVILFGKCLPGFSCLDQCVPYNGNGNGGGAGGDPGSFSATPRPGSTL